MKTILLEIIVVSILIILSGIVLADDIFNKSDNNIFKKLESFGFEFNGFLENSVTRVAWIDK